MKKVLSLLLTLAICLSLWACGGEKSVENAENTEKTETKKEITVETVAGTYKTTMWFLDETITLNSNTTYISSNGGKGTFTVTKEGLVCLDPVDSSSADRIFRYTDGGLRDFEDWVFEEDDEFGLVFTPDEKGLTEQTFQECVINSRMPASKYNWFALILKMDGSFELRTGYRGMTSIDIKETFNGTYSYSDSQLKLTYEGREYIMPVGENGFIQFNVFEKI